MNEFNNNNLNSRIMNHNELTLDSPPNFLKEKNNKKFLHHIAAPVRYGDYYIEQFKIFTKLTPKWKFLLYVESTFIDLHLG